MWTQCAARNVSQVSETPGVPRARRFQERYLVTMYFRPLFGISSILFLLRTGSVAAAILSDMAQYSLTHFKEHQDSINALAFSPDGRFLASGGDDCVVFVLDPTNGQVYHKIRSRVAITALEWDHSDEQPYRLFIGYSSGEVVIATVTAVRILTIQSPSSRVLTAP